MWTLTVGILFFGTVFMLWKAIAWRVTHTYLEDDSLWFLPLIERLWSEKSGVELIKAFHMPEVTLFDAVYYSFLKLVFGYTFSLHPIPSLLVHAVNGAVLYILLRKLDSSRLAAAAAGLIYLTFYGHYHTYIWPMSMHHLAGVLLILLFLCEYVDSLQRGGAA